jgi:DNA-binding PadR family transcriptional regulator
MERQFDKRHLAKRKRVYELTEKGERNIEAILNANDKIKTLMTNLLSR